MAMHPIETLARDPGSPYWHEGTPPTVLPSVVVFVDILGFTDRMRAAIGAGDAVLLLRRLREALNEALIHLDPRWMHLPRSSVQRMWDYKAFTDNVVIGYPIRRATELVLSNVFEKLGMFQLAMIQAGFFLRGAIAVGDLYMDRDIVFGEGLLDAVRTEQTIARDPRIVLSASTLDCVEKHLASYSDPSNAPQNRDLIKDADGQVFINYLDSTLIVENDMGPFVEPILDHKREIEAALHEYRGQPRIWSKYFWAATYHNYFCSLRDYFTEDHRIDLQSFQPTMQPLID